MWNVLLKRSIVWLLAIVSIVSISTGVTANAPQPPSLYWLKFDSPAKLQGVQIGQCQSKDCEQLLLLKQHGKCDKAGCIKSVPRLEHRKPLNIDCADNLCLVSLSPFYDKKELDPNQIRFIAQLEDQVYLSKVFPLNAQVAHKFSVKTQGRILDISVDYGKKITQSSLFQDLLLVFLVLTLGIELGIWAGFLRWQKVGSPEISLIIIGLLIVHAFSFPIVWFSFPGLEHFAGDSSRYGGLTWLVFSIGYGMILSLHSIWAKQPFSKQVVIGSIAYWLGAAVFTFLVTGLSGYGSPVPSADGLSKPMAIFAAELFVVIYEAWIIQRLRQDTLAFPAALGISLAANMASCIIGLAWAFFVPG
jgi:hypothetical protein